MSELKVRLDLTGQQFGRLAVVGYSHTNKHGQSMWKCVCECGNQIIVTGIHLKSGHSKSCGCMRIERAAARNKTHGMRHTRLYRIWLNMKNRCNNNRTKCYSYYGGRGIKVCDEWASDFRAFHDWAMANGYTDDLSIDRIDANGNYEPSNCRWATTREQANNKRSTLALTVNGETRTLKEWSEITGINYDTMVSRVKAGKSPEDVLSKEGLQWGFTEATT